MFTAKLAGGCQAERSNPDQGRRGHPQIDLSLTEYCAVVGITSTIILAETGFNRAGQRDDPV